MPVSTGDAFLCPSCNKQVSRWQEGNLSESERIQLPPDFTQVQHEHASLHFWPERNDAVRDLTLGLHHTKVKWTGSTNCQSSCTHLQSLTVVKREGGKWGLDRVHSKLAFSGLLFQKLVWFEVTFSGCYSGLDQCRLSEWLSGAWSTFHFILRWLFSDLIQAAVFTPVFTSRTVFSYISKAHICG